MIYCAYLTIQRCSLEDSFEDHGNQKTAVDHTKQTGSWCVEIDDRQGILTWLKGGFSKLYSRFCRVWFYCYTLSHTTPNLYVQ